MEKIFSKIEEYKRIIIFGHISPDGDCIGCQYGLMNLIKLNYPEKEVYVTGESDPFCSLIGTPTFINEELFKGSLGIVTDVSQVNRISDQRINQCEYKIKIDHHIESEKNTFYDLCYVEDKAASCTEILVDFIETFKNKLKMNKDVALPLYFGMLTDTGYFRFNNVTSKTLKNASILLQYNINLDEINEAINTYSFENMKFKGYICDNMIKTDYGFAYVKITKDILSKFNISIEVAASQVNILGMIKGIQVYCLFLEMDDRIRVRLRSKTMSIVEVANKYSGGGHATAAGCRLKNWDELDNFINDVKQHIENYKK